MKDLFTLLAVTLLGVSGVTWWVAKRRRKSKVVLIDNQQVIKVKLSKRKWKGVLLVSRIENQHPCVVLGCCFAQSNRPCAIECRGCYYKKYENE